jgi:polyferredoxin
MKLTQTRIISQAFFLGLFLFLLHSADFSRIEGYPVSLFLKIDPFHGLVTALANRTLYQGLLLGLLVLVPTFFIGRFFCGWVCPFGALHQFFAWLFRPRSRKQRVDCNRYRRLYRTKYFLLVVMIVLAIFGVVQAGLLDPISLLTRSLAASVFPAVGAVTGGELLPERTFQFGWLLGGVFIVLLAMNAVIPRFFCRVLCPLGALLGVCSRVSVLRIHRSETRCIHCDQCRSVCPAAADPQADVRLSECFVCMNCREVCPTVAISFRGTAPEERVIRHADVSRRRILQAGLVALVGFPLLRGSLRKDRHPSPSLIRPPGSEPEARFLAKCIKCGECMKVCPTNVIQPTLFEAGVEGVWTPIMMYRIGYCEYNCILCGQVCPTGAIREIDLDEKLGRGDYDKPIKLGTAFVDKGRCLPWAMNKPCIVCEEMCPVSPKAIYLQEAEVVNARGERLTVQRPVVDPARCIGCGLCESRCPVHDKRAIRVTSVGESRSKTNVLLLSDRQA